MKSIKSCLDKFEENDEPKLYLQIKLNYFLFDLINYLDLSKRREIQRIFNWLNIKTKSSFIQSSKHFLTNKTQFKKLKLRPYLVNLNSSNFNKELTNYYYGYPPKFNLIQMQTQLRTYTGDRYLLIKIIESFDVCKRDNLEFQKDNLSLINKQVNNKRKKLKKNELVVSLEFLYRIFKKFKDNPLLKTNLNDNFVLELDGYKFKNFLVIIYALYSNQLYLNLNNLSEIIQISIDLGIEKIIKFINKLILTNDPIYILFKLRIYFNEYDLHLIDNLNYLNYLDNLFDQNDNCFNDNSSYLNSLYSNNQMIYILSKVITNYDKLINYPGILNLEYEELNYLVCKKTELFYIFKTDKRNEFDVFRAVLDWYLFDKKNRENKTIDLLNKINYSNLSIKQLDKSINYFILNNYSNDIKNLIKNQLKFELKKRRHHLSNIIDKNFYQELLKSKQLSIEIIKEKKPELKLIEDIKIDKQVQDVIKLIDKDKKIKTDEKYEIFLINDDYLKNLILLGTYSIISSPLLTYTINERSIILLLGGFKSYSPYLKDQGRSMYHLIKTINGDSNTYSKQNIFNKSNDNSIYNLPSILTHDWFPLKERLPRNLAHFATIKIDNCIFILGGLDIAFLLLKSNHKLIKPISNCYLFNLLNNNWYKIKSMNYSRAYHQAIKYDNLIYVFGGLSYQASKLFLNNTMECYDIKKNSWSLVYDFNQLSILPCPRMAFGMELIDNLIVIAGGISELEGENNINFNSLLNDFWLFNLDEKEFKKLNNLNLPRSRAAFGLIRLENELLLIAGLEINNYDLYNNTNVLNKLNTFNDHTIISKTNVVNTFNLTNTNLTDSKKLKQTLISSSNTVLAFKLDHINNLNVKWFLHSKLNQPRIFPSICKYLNTILITGGKIQDHFYLKNLSIANYCSTYEVFNKFNLKWNKNQILFATFGSSLIELN